MNPRLYLITAIVAPIIISVMLVQGFDCSEIIKDHKELDNGLTDQGLIFKTYMNVLLYKIKRFQKTKSTLLGKTIYYSSLLLPIICTTILTIIMTIIKIIVKIINIKVISKNNQWQ